MSWERTCAICKPGVLQRRILGDIITRIEKKGFQIRALKMMRLSKDICQLHYAEHKGKPFYAPLVEYMASGPVIAMIISGENAVSYLRKLCGATNPHEAEPGTIRGDYAAITRMNIIHASDSSESAEREINIFFAPKEICEYEDGNQHWIN
ncbi:MAG: nucleoside-diphosphate kinase [Salinispira sp.]